ncbi:MULTISPECIES: DUF6223 family protein [Nonomuraea]|jgi:hypothetical protein|uniref:DUF6223 family protein n=1 Tax=Nonomuraea salmonea TaxID=46181 RepID=A0ABV5NG06_9ACTN
MSLLLALASPVCTSAAECAGQGVDTFLGTPERIWASVAALVAVGSTIIGWLALRNAGRWKALTALTLGIVGALNGAVKLAIADGGLGTGNGVFGAAMALALGLLGALLGRLALTRGRRPEMSR